MDWNMPLKRVSLPGARAPKDEEAIAVVDIDMKRCENVRRWWPFLRDRRIEEFHDLTKRFID